MLISISKFFYMLFIFYIIWFQNVFFSISNMPLVLGGLMIFFLFLHKLNGEKNTKIIIPLPLAIWIIFAVYILLTGFFLIDNIDHLFKSWFTYIQNIILIFYIINVSKVDGDNDFFQKTFWVLTIVYLVNMFFWGVESSRGVISLSPSTNPNVDGLILLLGVFFTLYYYKNNFFYIFFSTTLVGLYTYIILLTGSRTSFVGLTILIFVWSITVYRKHWKDLSIIKKILLLILLLSIGVFLLYLFIPVFSESILYSKLIMGGSTGGDIVRTGMYQEALNFFEENPLFGIGFKQFENLSIYGTYSHSTYAEIFSTTGIIGTILYFVPYSIIFYKLIKIYKENINNDISAKALQYLILMAVLLVLGTVRIHFYSLHDNIMFAVMISFCSTINKKSIKPLSKRTLNIF